MRRAVFTIFSETKPAYFLWQIKRINHCIVVDTLLSTLIVNCSNQPCIMCKVLFFAPLFSLFLIAAACAKTGDQEVIISAGKGLDEKWMQMKSISNADMLGINWSYQFFDYADKNILQLWFQGSYSYMRKSHLGNRQEQNIFELKPVLRWFPVRRVSGLFVEAGVGAGYLDNKRFGEINLSTNLNFSLHFAAGYQFSDRYLLSFRYSHFSNAGIKSPNPGFDFASLNWHFHF